MIIVRKDRLIDYCDSNGSVIYQPNAKQRTFNEFLSVIGTCKGRVEVNSNEKSLVKLTGESLTQHEDSLLSKWNNTVLSQQYSNSTLVPNEFNDSKKSAQQNVCNDRKRLAQDSNTIKINAAFKQLKKL